MIRRLLAPLLAGCVLLTWTAGTALAKCEGADPQPAFCHEIRVELNTSGGVGTFVAGRPTSFDLFTAGIRKSFDVWVALGDEPIDAMGVALTFIGADGTTIRVQAVATSEVGRWTAEVLLPTEGSWSAIAQVVDADGAAHRIEMNPIPVGKPASPPTTTPLTVPASPAVPAVPVALGLVGVAAAVLRRQLVATPRRRTALSP